MEFWNITASIIIALIIGGMAFFAAVMTPLVFTKLPPKISGPFIREVFPVYSKVMAILTMLAAVLLWGRLESILLIIVFAIFIWAWFWLMPKINHFRDAGLGGDKGADKTFNLLHKLSVFINLSQLATVTIVFVRIII